MCTLRAHNNKLILKKVYRELKSPNKTFLKINLLRTHITQNKILNKGYNKIKESTTMHPWCGGHSTNINTYRVWGVRVRVQVSSTHIHLD